MKMYLMMNGIVLQEKYIGENNMKIKISEIYTATPGGRFIKEGEFSGEHFRNTLLEPYFIETIKKSEKLIIDLDGGYGYSVGFLEEAFGGLVRKGYNKELLLETLIIISNEEQDLIDEIRNYILNNNITLIKLKRSSTK